MTGYQHRPSPTPHRASTFPLGASPNPARESGGPGYAPAPESSSSFGRAKGFRGAHGLYSNRYMHQPGAMSRTSGETQAAAPPQQQHQQNRGTGLNRNAREPPAGPASWVEK